MIRTVFAALMSAAPAFAPAAMAETPQKIVSLGGSVTEIVYALGAGDRVIARDTTSSFPTDVMDLPDVGYIRQLSPEGVLSAAPDLILAESDAGPPEAVDLLEAAGVPFIIIPEEWTAEGIEAKILAVGAALDMPDAAAALGAEVRDKITAIQEKAVRQDGPLKRVLFILSTRGGRVMAAGSNTSADAMIRLAGGVNAVDGIDGYKPLSNEAITVAAPDVILMMDRGGDHGVANATLKVMAALRLTPAVQNDAIVRMNGLYLLGFGPRTAEAIADLNAQIYPE